MNDRVSDEQIKELNISGEKLKAVHLFNYAIDGIDPIGDAIFDEDANESDLCLLVPHLQRIENAAIQAAHDLSLCLCGDRKDWARLAQGAGKAPAHPAASEDDHRLARPQHQRRDRVGAGD